MTRLAVAATAVGAVAIGRGLRACGQDVPALYPKLEHRWDGNNKQLTWKSSLSTRSLISVLP
jgi:hypothetical protein